MWGGDQGEPSLPAPGGGVHGPCQKWLRERLRRLGQVQAPWDRWKRQVGLGSAVAIEAVVELEGSIMVLWQAETHVLRRLAGLSHSTSSTARPLTGR